MKLGKIFRTIVDETISLSPLIITFIIMKIIWEIKFFS